MGAKIDLTGKKFGRLTVVSENGKRNGRTHWDCLCDCGRQSIIDGSKLRSGHTKSCGCLKKEYVSNIGDKGNIKHGMYKHPLFKIWIGIKERCYNKKRAAYSNYGGRGITVCPEWLNDFQAFYDWAMANGWEKGLTIDRIDNNGNYTPENCRWATRKLQARNQRSNSHIEYNGRTKILIEWCEELNLHYDTVRVRIGKLGWTPEKAFETPIIKEAKIYAQP